MKVCLFLAAAVLVASAQGARVPRAASGKYDAVLDELREVARHLKERQLQEPAGEVAEAREVQAPQEFAADNGLRSDETFDEPGIAQREWIEPQADFPQREWDEPQAALPQREWDEPQADLPQREWNDPQADTPQREWDEPQEWADPDPVGADTYRQESEFGAEPVMEERGYREEFAENQQYPQDQEDIPEEYRREYQEEVPVENRAYEEADAYEPVAVDDIPYEQRRRNMVDNDLYRREEETEVQYADSDEDPYNPVDVDAAPQYGDQTNYGQDMGPVNDLEETEGEYVNSDPGQQEAEDLSPQEREFEPMQDRAQSDDKKPDRKPRWRCFGCEVSCGRGGDRKESTCGGKDYCKCFCSRFWDRATKRMDIKARCWKPRASG